jgi:hypothetical protein
VAVDVALGVTEGVAVGVDGVQAALMISARSKTTSAIDRCVIVLLVLWVAGRVDERGYSTTT